MVFGVLGQQRALLVDGVPRKCSQQDAFKLRRDRRIDGDFRISHLSIEVLFQTSVETIDFGGFVFELLEEGSPLIDLVRRRVRVGIESLRFLYKAETMI